MKYKYYVVWFSAQLDPKDIGPFSYSILQTDRPIETREDIELVRQEIGIDLNPIIINWKRLG